MNLAERVRYTEEQAKVTTPGGVAHLTSVGLVDPAEMQTCWFCAKAPFDDEATKVELFYRVVGEERSGGPMARTISTQYLSFALPIPRCRSCCDVHDRAESGLAVLVLLIVACGAAAGWFAGGAAFDFVLARVALAILGSLVGLGLGAFAYASIAAARARAAGIASTSRETESLKRLMAKGVSMGLHPPS